MKYLVHSVILAAALALTAGVATAQNMPIAVVGPITGSNAALREQMKRGAERWGADINAKGGGVGKKLDLIVADDACDPKQAVAAANDVVGKKVVFVAGHYCSSSSIPASAVYNEAGVPQMTPPPTNPRLERRRGKEGLDQFIQVVRPRRGAGRRGRQVSRRSLQGKTCGGRPRQDCLWQRHRRRDHEGDECGRFERGDV